MVEEDVSELGEGVAIKKLVEARRVAAEEFSAAAADPQKSGVGFRNPLP